MQGGRRPQRRSDAVQHLYGSTRLCCARRLLAPIAMPYLGTCLAMGDAEGRECGAWLGVVEAWGGSLPHLCLAVELVGYLRFMFRDCRGLALHHGCKWASWAR